MQGTKNEAASRERERKNINQSLLTLGRVISSLKEGAAGAIAAALSSMTACGVLSAVVLCVLSQAAWCSNSTACRL